MSRKDAPRWVVEDFIGTTTTEFSGKSGSGKTTLLAAIALDVASGRSSFMSKKRICRHGPVLVLVNDPDEEEAWARRAFDYPGGRIDDDALQIRWLDRAESFDPTLSAIAQVTRDHGTKPAFVVLDNVSGYLPNGDVNDGRDCKHLTEQGDRVVRDAGVPLVTVHHSSLGGAKGGMGANELRRWMRHKVHLYEGLDGGQLRVESAGRFTPRKVLRLGLDFAGDCAQFRLKDEEIKGPAKSVGARGASAKPSLNEALPRLAKALVEEQPDGVKTQAAAGVFGNERFQLSAQLMARGIKDYATFKDGQWAYVDGGQ